jgi:hypothetical protein
MHRFAILCCFTAGSLAQTPDDAAFTAQRDAILPAAEELGWRAVPWRPELGDALAEADRVQQPVLLWAMNGHPLGQC